MGSPQNAALRHRLSSIRAIIQSFETDLPTASPVAKPDIELLISFYKDAEKNAKNEIELHQLTHGGIDALREDCSHPERYITKGTTTSGSHFRQDTAGATADPRRTDRTEKSGIGIGVAEGGSAKFGVKAINRRLVFARFAGMGQGDSRCKDTMDEQPATRN